MKQGSAATLLLAAACIAGTAQSQTPALRWVLQDFPPAEIVIDGKPGPGFRDEAIRVIMANWTDVEHQFVTANAARTWLMLSDKEQVCYVGALQTPDREKIAYFTPFSVLPPLQIVVRQDTVAKLPVNADGEVILQEVLASPALQGFVIDTRSYGKGLDEVLAKRARKDAVTTVQAGDLGKTVPLMLAAKRGDYLIEYEFVINYHKQQNQPQLDNLVSLPIAGFSKMVTSNVVCPRSPWGLQAIKRIDAILARTAESNGIRASVEKWLSPEAVRRYRGEMNAYVQRRKKVTDAAVFD